MAFDLDEVRFLAANAAGIAKVAPQVALTKKTVFADRATLEASDGA